MNYTYLESLRPEDVRKTLEAKLTRETRTGTKSDSERCYIVQTKAERAKEKDVSKREGVAL